MTHFLALTIWKLVSKTTRLLSIPKPLEQSQNRLSSELHNLTHHLTEIAYIWLLILVTFEKIRKTLSDALLSSLLSKATKQLSWHSLLLFHWVEICCCVDSLITVSKIFSYAYSLQCESRIVWIIYSILLYLVFFLLIC